MTTIVPARIETLWGDSGVGKRWRRRELTGFPPLNAALRHVEQHQAGKPRQSTASFTMLTADAKNSLNSMIATMDYRGGGAWVSNAP